MSDGSIHLLVGTTKGAFVLDGDAGRSRWTVRGPYCDGWPINHVIGDPAGGTIWAGGGGDWSGAGVWRSDDVGHTWQLSKLTSGQMDAWAADDPGFAASIGWTESPAPFGDRFSQVWSLARVGTRLYAGAKPATLLVSDDDGATWETVKGLTDHPSAAEWGPGAAGLVLHTIVADPADPDKLWVGISAAGVFASQDGGVTWERRNDLADPRDGEGHAHPAAASDGHTGLLRAPRRTGRRRRRRALPAEPPRGLALGRRRPDLARHHERACHRPSASPCGRTRATQAPSGPFPSTATPRAATRRTPPPRSGALAMPVGRGRHCAPACRRRRASSQCSAKA